MKKEDAIKYLQQLYPNGGHCWLDEQRIEAISMAIKALQDESVSEKKCMFTKDSYTDEDRKVLCEDCKEKCEYSKKEELISDDLEEAAKLHVIETRGEDVVWDENARCAMLDFKAGAQWQKEKEYTCYEEAFEDGAKWKVENLWKPVDGDDLPEYEREVVVFTQNYPDDAGMLMVAIGHRPNPEGFDGKSLTTGEVEHYTPKTYGKGGWNIPDIVYWLDVKLPKDIEL